MADWNGELFQYCDETIELTVTKDGSAYSLTDCLLIFLVKRKIDDEDSEAVISKTSSGSDQINIVDAASGRADIYITRTDTAINAADYIYGIALVDANDKKHPILSGDVAIVAYPVKEDS